MKKNQLSILLLLTLLLLAPFLTAQNTITTTENIVGEIDPSTGLPKGLEPVADLGEKISEGEVTKDYLKTEWEKILNKHPLFSKIVNFYKTLNPVFRWTLGEEFSFTLTFLFILLLWFWFVAVTFTLIKKFQWFSETISLIIGIGLTIILAHTGLIRLFAENLIVIVLFTENTLGRIILSVIIIVGIIGAYLGIKTFAQSIGKGNEKKRKTKVKKAEEDIIKLGEQAKKFEEKLN